MWAERSNNCFKTCPNLVRKLPHTCGSTLSFTKHACIYYICQFCKHAACIMYMFNRVEPCVRALNRWTATWSWRHAGICLRRGGLSLSTFLLPFFLAVLTLGLLMLFATFALRTLGPASATLVFWLLSTVPINSSKEVWCDFISTIFNWIRIIDKILLEILGLKKSTHPPIHTYEFI